MSQEFGKIKNYFHPIPGYHRFMKTVISIDRFNKNEVAKFRFKVLKHWQRYGLNSTLDAYPVGRSSLFEWKSQLVKSKGRLSSLIPQSTKPLRVRQMIVDWRLLEFIKQQRELHYRLGKNKLFPLAEEFCLKLGIKVPSVSLIGKIINRNKLFFQKPSLSCAGVTRKKPEYRHKTRIKHVPRVKSGGYVEGDTIETFIDGLKRYTISFTDIYQKITHSKTYKTKSSQNALDCFLEFRKILPKKIIIHTVQTDNGSEFSGTFDNYLTTKTKIKHVWIYPNCPKINCFIERYNRSIQEEWLNQHLDEMIDVDQFNQDSLPQYLFFYNNKRVHEGLQLRTPAEVVGEEIKSPVCM